MHRKSDLRQGVPLIKMDPALHSDDRQPAQTAGEPAAGMSRYGRMRIMGDLRRVDLRRIRNQIGKAAQSRSENDRNPRLLPQPGLENRQRLPDLFLQQLIQ